MWYKQHDKEPIGYVLSTGTAAGHATRLYDQFFGIIFPDIDTNNNIIKIFSAVIALNGRRFENGHNMYKRTRQPYCDIIIKLITITGTTQIITSESTSTDVQMSLDCYCSRSAEKFKKTTHTSIYNWDHAR